MKNEKIKRNKNTKNNKKKIILFGVILVIVIAVIIGIVILISNVLKSPNDVNNDNHNNNTPNNSVINKEAKLTGKLADYIKDLTENYSIKYHGKFKNVSGEMVESIVEYTTNGKDYALRTTDLDIDLICRGTTLYSISHRYKMIVEMDKSNVDISEYNLVSDIGQTFVKTYKESINGTEYEVAEYDYNSNPIKYYFKQNDVKLIRYNSEDISIIRVEKKTNNELFVKPEGYSNF